MARRSRQEWAEVVASYEASGLSQETFARREGVAASTLRYWLYRFRRERLDGTPAEASRFIEIASSEPGGAGSGNAGVVLRVGGSVALELSELPEPGYLAALARALSC